MSTQVQQPEILPDEEIQRPKFSVEPPQPRRQGILAVMKQNRRAILIGAVIIASGCGRPGVVFYGRV